MTTKHDVIALFKRQPGATSSQLAYQLKCTPEYVRATLQRNGLKLAAAVKRSDNKLSTAILPLGRAAQSAGLTVGDIEKIGRRKC